jgi:DNA-directed RNA polymerase specialized sigma24 family protein
LSERDPDAELVARVGEQDPAAVRTLVSRKLPRLLALATRMLGDRMEAEDVAQEAFVRIWKQAPHWKEGEARFDTWIHRVALNLCYDRLRGRREDPVAELPDEADPQALPDMQLEARVRDAARSPGTQLLPGALEYRSCRVDGRHGRRPRKLARARPPQSARTTGRQWL